MSSQALEQENQDLQERIKLALLGYNAGIYEWNMLDDSAYYSDEWKSMLGYENDDLEPKLSTWAELVHPDDYKRVIESVQQSVQNLDENIEAIHRLKHKNGKWIWILGRGLIKYNKENEAVKMVGIHTDITKQKENELKIQRQAQMIQQTHDSVIYINLDGIIEMWNRGSELLFGYKKEEVIGKHVAHLHLKNDTVHLDKVMEYLLSNDELHQEKSFKKKNGDVIYVDLSLSLLKNESQTPIGLIAYLQDITLRKEMEKELFDSHHNLQEYLHAIDEIEIGLFVVNEDYTIRYMNHTMKKWFGDQTNKLCYSAVAQLDEKCSYCKLHEVIHENKKIIYNPKTSDGKIFEIYATSVHNADGTISKMEVIRDITAQIEAKELLEKEKDQLNYQANHDPLTKLPNRTLFYDRLEQSLVKSERNKHKVALFFIDLDHFKEINDKYGHFIGDLVLQEVAKRIANEIRKEDTFARLSGDEFTLILENLESENDPTILANKILTVIQKPLILKDKQEIFISLSIGISLYPNDAKSKFELIKAADTAMYNAKKSGRNQFKYFKKNI